MSDESDRSKYAINRSGQNPPMSPFIKGGNGNYYARLPPNKIGSLPAS